MKEDIISEIQKVNRDHYEYELENLEEADKFLNVYNLQVEL